MSKINHDRVAVDGKAYQSQAANGYSCDGCAFKSNRYCFHGNFDCIGDDREDGKNVIYKPAINIKEIK